MARPKDKYGRNIGRPKSGAENNRFMWSASTLGASFDVYPTATGGMVYDPITRQFSKLSKKTSIKKRGR